MAKQDTHSDLVAAFMAKGGTVQKLGVSATNGMTQRDWNDQVRGISGAWDDDRRFRSREQEAEIAAERARDENGYYKS